MRQTTTRQRVKGATRTKGVVKSRIITTKKEALPTMSRDRFDYFMKKICAVAEGLGTCWIGAFDEAQVKEILGIPPDVRVVELMPVGYPKNPAPVSKTRLPLDKIVKRETWQ